MPGMNTFFNELIQKDYFEKQASENENIKNALGECGSSVLQKLAQELGALSEERPTIQEKLAEQDEDQEDKEAGAEPTCGEAEECNAEEAKEAEPEEEKSEDEEAKEAEPEEEKSEDEEPKEAGGDCDNKGECENADTEKEEDKCDNKGECENEKEAMEKEALEQEAYFVAQEKLASSELTVADFIFEKCANEHVSEYIAETAEKLACLCEKSALQIADEILDSVMSKLG